MKALLRMVGPLIVESYKPSEPRDGEPRQPNKAYYGLLVDIGPY